MTSVFNVRTILLLCLLLFFMRQGEVNAGVATADEIKAAYLYHLLHFVKWPSGYTGSTNDPINICVIGQGDHNDALKALASRSIATRPIMVRFVEQSSRAFDCQLLYLHDTNIRRLKSLLQLLGKKGVLTVGESNGFVDDGGMIGFVMIDGTVRMEINLSVAKDDGFEVSAKLLEVAVKIIKRPSGGS